MNPIDIASAGILLILIGMGIWTGLMRALFRMGAIAAGILGGWLLGGTFGAWLPANINGFPAPLTTPAGKTLAFLTCWLGVTVVGFLIGKLVRKSPLGPLDRLGGGLLGMAKGVILCLVIMALLAALPARGELQAMRDSSMAYSVHKWAAHLVFAHLSVF